MDWPYHGLDESQDISKMFLQLMKSEYVFHYYEKHINEEVVEKEKPMSDEEVVETEYVDVGEGDEGDFQPDDNIIPEKEPEVDMGGFHLEVDANIEHFRK